MKCGECTYKADTYMGVSFKNSRYTYCSLRNCGTYKYGDFKRDGWTKVHKNSEPKWCPLKTNVVN